MLGERGRLGALSADDCRSDLHAGVRARTGVRQEGVTPVSAPYSTLGMLLIWRRIRCVVLMLFVETPSRIVTLEPRQVFGTARWLLRGIYYW